MKFAGPDLDGYGNNEDEPEDRGPDQVTVRIRLGCRLAEVGHRKSIAAGFAYCGTKYLYDPKNERYLRNLAQGVS